MRYLWLPKDERKLLRIYYSAIKNDLRRVDSTLTAPTANIQCEIWKLVKVFQVKDYVEAAKSLLTEEHRPVEATEYNKLIQDKRIVEAANAALVERELIKISSGTDQYLDFNLTIEGYDLGRKYSDWRLRSGLWFAEYRYHWIMFILSFFGGIAGGAFLAIIDWLIRGNR